MIPGRVLIHFRRGALDSLNLSLSYIDFYGGDRAKQKNDKEPLSGPYGRAGDQRGYPDILRNELFGERFYFDSSNNVVRDSSLKHFFISEHGHYLRRLTAASPLDTISVTRTGDTMGCDHSDWLILSLDSSQNPLLVSYLLLAAFQRDIVGAWPDYRGGVLCGHPADTAGDAKYVHCQRNTWMIGAETAWWYEVGDSSIIVGVDDAGVDYRQPDFGDSVLGLGHKFQVGWNYDWDHGGHYIYDNPEHGTQMSGILGALTNNMLGSPFFDQTVAGVAGGWGMLMPHPMARGRGVTIDIAASDLHNGLTGLEASLFEESARSPYSPYGWGVHAVNISEGISPVLDPFEPLHAAVNFAFESGVVICVAMNEGKGDAAGDSTTPFNPALYEEPWVIAVGGSTPTPYKAKILQSDYGRTMDLIAPAGSTAGCGVSDVANYTTNADPPAIFNFQCSGGTSAACANTTGSAALLLSHFHRLDSSTFQHNEPEDYQGILKASAWRGDAFRLSDSSLKNAWTDSTGWGHLDIGKAFQMLDPDRTQYGYSAYSLYHYSYDDTTLMSFGAWQTLLVNFGSNVFGPSYDPSLSWFPDTLPKYAPRKFQLPYSVGKCKYRIVTVTVTLPDLWDRSDSVPLFAWGRSGGAAAKSGWNLSAPANYEAGWTQVLNGTGWDPDSLNEGIFHNQGTTFVLRTGQWQVDTGGGHYITVPPDSMLGLNFTVFGRLSGSSGVTRQGAKSPSAESLILSASTDGNMLKAAFYTDESHEGMKLEVFDVLGRPVGEVAIGHASAGWNSISVSSASLPSGAYVCRISGSGYLISKNVLIVK
jgi:hypothetical protein